MGRNTEAGSQESHLRWLLSVELGTLPSVLEQQRGAPSVRDGMEEGSIISCKVAAWVETRQWKLEINQAFNILYLRLKVVQHNNVCSCSSRLSGLLCRAALHLNLTAEATRRAGSFYSLRNKQVLVFDVSWAHPNLKQMPIPAVRPGFMAIFAFSRLLGEVYGVIFFNELYEHKSLDWWCSCPPVWYFLMPRYDCPSASPFHSGPVCAWTRRQPAWRTSPPDGSPGWFCVCQPLLHASLSLLPWPAAVHSGWRSPRPGPGSWEPAFHRGGGTLLGLSPQQSAWWHLDLWRWDHNIGGSTSMEHCKIASAALL